MNTEQTLWQIKALVIVQKTGGGSVAESSVLWKEGVHELVVVEIDVIVHMTNNTTPKHEQKVFFIFFILWSICFSVVAGRTGKEKCRKISSQNTVWVQIRIRNRPTYKMWNIFLRFNSNTGTDKRLLTNCACTYTLGTVHYHKWCESESVSDIFEGKISNTTDNVTSKIVDSNSIHTPLQTLKNYIICTAPRLLPFQVCL